MTKAELDALKRKMDAADKASSEASERYGDALEEYQAGRTDEDLEAEARRDVTRVAYWSQATVLALLRQLDKARENPSKWIKIADRKPEQSGYYPVYDCFKGVFVAYFRLSDGEGDRDQWSTPTGGTFDAGNVTHWQPLLAPPPKE